MRPDHACVAPLRRLFWSVYGRYVWDRRPTARSQAAVRRVVGLLETRRSHEGEHVLDAGCGTGEYTVGLTRAGFQVTGIDYAAGMLTRARSKLALTPAGSVALRMASLDRPLPFDDASFDHSILISVLQAVAEPRFTLAELWRVLKPGGTLVVVHYPRPPLHDLPLLDEVKARLAGSGARGPLAFAMVTAKSWAERAGATRYWTAEGLERMLLESRFRVVSAESVSPIIVVAERPTA
jgi:ubiquinone/menaquinone biosynthesis C-methylase UbiE